MDDAYTVQDGLERLMALKDGDTFLVADGWGDLKGGADGLFVGDTRILSRLVMKVGQARPSQLSSGVSQDNVYFTCHSTNRPLPPMGGRSAPAGVLHIERRRFVWDRRMFERIRMVNHGVEDVLLPLTIDFAADFADIFQVRGALREKRGTTEPPVHDGRRVTFAYVGLDEVMRTSCLAFSEPPARLTGSRADFMFSLPKGRRCDLYVECGPDRCDQPDQVRYRQNALQARLAMRARRRRGASLRGPRSPRFNDWLDQSRADVALLTTDLPTGPYPYAGVPWFSTPFGRDGIITAWQMLWLDPSLARGVLTYLAMRQATDFSAFQDSAPGKIMHETRGGEMSALGEVPFGLYYGGVDTTCLFVALAGAYARRTGDFELIRRLWPNLIAAVGWMKDHGDFNGDGQPGLEGLRGLHLPQRRPVSERAHRPAGGAGLRLCRLAGDGRTGGCPGRRPAGGMGRPGRAGPGAGRGPVLDGGRGLLRYRPGRRRSAVPVDRIERRPSVVHRPALRRAGDAGDEAVAGRRVPLGLGRADPGHRSGPVQSHELSQRLGLAARHRHGRCGHGPLRRAPGGGPAAGRDLCGGGAFPPAPARTVLRLRAQPRRAAHRLSGRLPAPGLGGGVGLPDASVGPGDQH